METLSPESRRSRPALESLTALRFFAALYVVLFHRRAELSGAGELVDRIVAHGYLGVPIFFVLSGFVLAYNYLSDDGRFRGSTKHFYVARLARIYPVYALAVLLFTPVALSSSAIPVGQLGSTLLASLTLTQAWTEHIYWNRPGWTLSVEAFFYLVFPFIVPPLCRLGRRRRVAAIALLWAAAIVPVAIYTAIAPADEIWLRVVKHNPVCRLPSFLIGALMGSMVVGAAGRRWWAYVTVAVVGIAAAAAIDMPGSWAILWHNGFLTPLFGLLMYGLALRDRTRVPRWGVPALLRRLGEASYAIYILQTPIHALCMSLVAIAMRAGLADRPAVAASPLFVLAYTIVLGGCALLCLRWFEMPARALIRRWAEDSTHNRIVIVEASDRRQNVTLPVHVASTRRQAVGYRSA